MATAVGGAQVATGGTAVASSVYGGGYEPAKAFDGDAGTSFYAGGPSRTAGEWIGYHFTADVTLAEVRMTKVHDGGPEYTPRSLAIDYSANGVAWQNAGLYDCSDWTTGVEKAFPLPGF